ncbi:MAG: hypothetical protein P4L99_28375 [Chthoniobacter sp.]|nr:hypothetical protein [Chthoniobacter sp.]
MSDPDPDYPLSLFRDAFSSVVFRGAAFFLTCLGGITLGCGLHGDWRNPFNIDLASFVVIVNILTGIDLILVAILFLFLYRRGSWPYLLVAFFVQSLGAWLAASTK